MTFIQGEPKEIAALVLALQERQRPELHITPDQIAKAVCAEPRKKEENEWNPHSLQ